MISHAIKLGFVQSTQEAALAALPLFGTGPTRKNKNAADGKAVKAMRQVLDYLPMQGLVVIGEGEKHKAPEIPAGTVLGQGGPHLEIAVDPVDGTSLLCMGRAGSISAIAVCEGEGSMAAPKPFYMQKIATGPGCGVNILASIGENLDCLARAKKCNVADLLIGMLLRERHHEEIYQIVREEGAKVLVFRDGDIMGGILPALNPRNFRPRINYPRIDALMGVGGSPEAIITACALRCLGGEMQCRLWQENQGAFGPVMKVEDLARSPDIFVAITFITDTWGFPGIKDKRISTLTFSMENGQPKNSFLQVS